MENSETGRPAEGNEGKQIKNRIFAVDVRGIEAAEEFERWYAVMGNERKEKINKIRRMGDRQRSLGAGITLRMALEAAEADLSGSPEAGASDPGTGGLQYCDLSVLPAGNPRFHVKQPKNGKPFLAGSGICFNLSHAGDYAVCAVSGKEVGIDIESMRVFSRNLEKYICTQEEMDAIKAASAYEIPGEKLQEAGSRDVEAWCMTRLWTVKESVMKYYGSGLSIRPSNILLSFEEGGTGGSGALRVSMKGEWPVPASQGAGGMVRPEDLRFSFYRIADHAVTVCSPDCPFV